MLCINIQHYIMRGIVENGFIQSRALCDTFQEYIRNMTCKKLGAQLNILYVCDAQYLQQKMSRVRFWAIEALGKHENVNLTVTGPGFTNFNKGKTLQQNILDFNIKFDLVIWYKPLNPNYNFDKTSKLPFKTCLRYNEMWDVEWTRKEIDETRSDIIISHHQNDCLKYKELYKNDLSRDFVYIPHFADPRIFKPLDVAKDIDILLSGVTKEKHYPLKHRLYNLIMQNKNTLLGKYNIHQHQHPTYVNENSFENVSQIEYNKIINRSKLCIACTSKYNYRLGKYVEIPSAGSVIIGDLPFEDAQFKNFVVEVNNNMSDSEILNAILHVLSNPSIIDEKRRIGMEWAENHVTSTYVDALLKLITATKIFIISDEIRADHPEFKNQKWICDVLKQEFMDTFPIETTHDARQADVIWYLGPWNHRYIPRGFTREEWLSFLKTKRVVCTQHHIDEEKLAQGQLDTQFKFMRDYGTHFHAICESTKTDMQSHFESANITCKKLWVNRDVYYHIPDKKALREKWGFSHGAHLVGSFQKDTEGATNLPKLSKGPDLFVKIIKDMYQHNTHIEVILTGLRREYIINELNKVGIKYHYFNMISMEEINELYNCLDLYVVSSRCEGGPRSVFEAGLTKTPIISSRVGIAPELMDSSALFDSENWLTYKDAVPATDILHENVTKLTSREYMEEFKNELFCGNKFISHDTHMAMPGKKTVLIGTTAINRPLLHSDNMPEWYNYINKLDKSKYDIRWFINIDYVEKLGETVSSTAENFQKIITDIPITIVEKEQQDGNFLQACKRVSSNIEKYVLDENLNMDDVIVIWLEDDWKLHSNNIPLQELIENYLSNLTCINLSFIRANYIHALAPSVTNYKLWSNLHLAAWKEQKDHIDPEHCVGLYYKKMFGKYEDLYNITLINQYKSVSGDFFNHSMFQYDNSYYCYDVEKEGLVKTGKYIRNEDLPNLIKNKVTFIRITSSSCSDYGRQFMEKYGIIKNTDKQNNSFYK
jgi:hypothetical protein